MKWKCSIWRNIVTTSKQVVTNSLFRILDNFSIISNVRCFSAKGEIILNRNLDSFTEASLRLYLQYRLI